MLFPWMFYVAKMSNGFNQPCEIYWSTIDGLWPLNSADIPGGLIDFY